MGKGIADADIPDMMSQRGCSPSMSSTASSAASMQVSAAVANKAPKRLKLADHARALTAPAASCETRGNAVSSPDAPSNTFSADLLDVLAGSPPPGDIPAVLPPVRSPPGQWLNGTGAREAPHEEEDSDFDDEVLLRAVLEDEKRISRSRACPSALVPDSQPLFRS